MDGFEEAFISLKSLMLYSVIIPLQQEGPQSTILHLQSTKDKN